MSKDALVRGTGLNARLVSWFLLSTPRRKSLSGPLYDLVELNTPVLYRTTLPLSLYIMTLPGHANLNPVERCPHGGRDSPQLQARNWSDLHEKSEGTFH